MRRKIAERQIVTKKAELRIDKGILWACCPTCGKKAIPLHSYTMCYKLPWKCQNTKCLEKEFEINYRENMCLI